MSNDIQCASCGDTGKGVKPITPCWLRTPGHWAAVRRHRAAAERASEDRPLRLLGTLELPTILDVHASSKWDALVTGFHTASKLTTEIVSVPSSNPGKEAPTGRWERDASDDEER